MKKLVSLLLTLALMMSLVACGGGSETQTNGNASAEKETENSAGVQVDEGLLNVDVTLAASFLSPRLKKF